MGLDLRLPNITGPTEREKLSQMQSYLFQLVEQLQWALQNIDTSNGEVVTSTPKSHLPSVAGSYGVMLTGEGDDPQSTFNSIKSLIIKSADIVEAYYEEINRRLESIYVAQSDFGDYAQRTSQEIEETSTSITQRFENVQAVINDTDSRIADVVQDLQESKQTISNNIQGVRDSVTGVNALLEDTKTQVQGSLDDIEVYITELQSVIIGVTAYLKSGLLYYTDAGIPVYGIEIGQSVKDELSGEEVFNKYARFTSERLSFYDNNGNEVAYISDKKLFIRIAEITVAFKIGGLMDLVMANGDVVTKWVGG